MQIFDENPTWRNVKQVAELLGVTPRRVRKLASQGRIKGATLHIREGWLIPPMFYINPGKRGPTRTGLAPRKPAIKKAGSR